jgi:hypothetical protein
MSRLSFRLRPLLALVLFATTPAIAAVNLTPWSPLFKGIDLARGEADAMEPSPQNVTAVRVHLFEPEIEFFSSPDNGDAPLETRSETVSAFLVRHRLQIAINANFYTPCCAPGDKDLYGLAISRGIVVSPPDASVRGRFALGITRDNVPAIVPTAEPLDLGKFWTAVAGSDRVLVDGRKQTFPDEPFYSAKHPRSAVGITADRRYLLLLVIDGRQPGSAGASMAELAEWLLRFGAYEALNLDGGGSTALARAEGGKAKLLNRPSGAKKKAEDDAGSTSTIGRERSNGNNFGVFARPLDRPIVESP